jgi:tetratricopeptide (TPR) repeat protein
VGRRFWDAVVEALSDEERLTEADLQALIDRLGERKLVFQEARSAFAGAHEYLFKHAILHDVTYETVLLRLRRLYHRQAAEWLETNCSQRLDEYAGLIAMHYEQAHEIQKAVTWLRKAGRAALAVSATSSALDAFQRALALTPEEDPARADLLEHLGVAHMLVGKFDQASHLLQQSIALARQQEDWVTLAKSLNQLCFIVVSRNGLEAGRGMAEEGMAAARRSGDPNVIANLIMRIVDFMDDMNEQQRLMNEALEYFRKAGDRSGAATCLMNIGIMLAEANRYPEAGPYYQEAAEIYRQIHNRWGEANCIANLGSVRIKAGEYEAAIELCKEALRIEREIGDRESACFALLDLGDAMLHLGQDEQALDYLRRSLIEAREVGVTGVMLEDLARAAQIYARRGEAQRAGRILGVLKEHPAWDGDWHELTDPGLQLLSPVMSPAELEAAMAQGKAQGLEALAAEVLEKNVRTLER